MLSTYSAHNGKCCIVKSLQLDLDSTSPSVHHLKVVSEPSKTKPFFFCIVYIIYLLSILYHRKKFFLSTVYIRIWIFTLSLLIMLIQLPYMKQYNPGNLV